MKGGRKGARDARTTQGSCLSRALLALSSLAAAPACGGAGPAPAAAPLLPPEGKTRWWLWLIGIVLTLVGLWGAAQGALSTISLPRVSSSCRICESVAPAPRPNAVGRLTPCSTMAWSS